MELKQLRHLVSVVDAGSFSRAAKDVAISQPALTRSIKLLEQRLGLRLFERTTRRVIPTVAGLRLYKRAKLILAESNAAIADLQDPTWRKRQLRIGIAPLFASTIIPNAIQRFYEDAPDVEVSVESGLFETLTSRLAEADLDLVVSNLPYGKLEDDLTSEAMFDIDVVYLVGAEHELARKRGIALSQLLAYPWAVVDESHANDLYGYIFASQGGSISPIRVRTNSLNLLKSLVQTPPWITLLPLHMAQQELARGDLCVLDVAGGHVKRRGGIVYRRAYSDDGELKRFSDCVRDACRTSA